jgi:4-alpha-glucanotransferase
MLVQMEDLAGEERQVNMPGTADAVPNWRRKLGRDFVSVLEDARAAAILTAIRRERPSGRGS